MSAHTRSGRGGHSCGGVPLSPVSSRRAQALAQCVGGGCGAPGGAPTSQRSSRPACALSLGPMPAWGVARATPGQAQQRGPSPPPRPQLPAVDGALNPLPSQAEPASLCLRVWSVSPEWGRPHGLPESRRELMTELQRECFHRQILAPFQIPGLTGWG